MGKVARYNIENEEDWTEEGVIDELLEAGVPAEDIVPSFRSPEVRRHLGLAVG